MLLLLFMMGLYRTTSLPEWEILLYDVKVETMWSQTTNRPSKEAIFTVPVREDWLSSLGNCLRIEWWLNRNWLTE